MKDNNKIVMIPRSLLHPHPDNPRKDLGDLKELADSIAEHGIMQNLTVVPDEGDGDGYKILIGHRRFAASEGVLDELPCVVAKGLTDREQVGIMLCENMQRSDLTYLEQAHGFQMMMDLGDTIETISEKTGFSKATVKHRLAINELDPEKLKETNEIFQLTISDYIALEKIDDVEERNEILDFADNSQDLKARVEQYLQKKKEAEDFAYFKKFFDEAGWVDETEKDNWFYYRDGFHNFDNKLANYDITDGRIPEDKLKKLIAEIKGDIHYGLCYHTIHVRKYKKSSNKSNEEDQRKVLEARNRKNRRALREIRSQICDAYMDFILNSEIKFGNSAKELSTLYCLLDVCRMDEVSVQLYELNENFYSINDKVSLKGYNKMTKDHPFKDFVNWSPLFQLLANIWFKLAGNYEDFMDSYWRVNEHILEGHQAFMNVLKDMGFQIKEEWKPVLDGTSDLYKKEDK